MPADGSSVNAPPFCPSSSRLTAASTLVVKEVSVAEMIARSVAKVAAGAGVAALLLWLTYVMLDFGHMQSGFTLPQSSY